MSFKKMMFSTAMMSSVRVLRLLAQFIAIPILSRMLSPAEYGLVAIAMPFAMFAMMIADAGIGMSLVRTPVSDRIAWSTSFWLCILLGIILSLIMAALAPLASAVFGHPQLTPMIIALSFVVMAQAIHLIPVAALQQAERFRSIALVEVLATAVGIGTAVYMAYHGYGAWALIGQQIAFFAVRVTLMCWLSPFRPLMVFKWKEVCEHVRFGRNVLGTGLVNYFSRSFDNWIVGKALGAATLGFYSMAFQFARLPSMLVTGPLQYVMYAQLAGAKDDTASLARAYLVVTRLLALLVLPTVGMVAAAHGPIFTLMLSDKWESTGLTFMILAPACAVQAVMAITETVLFALGRTDIQLRASIEYNIVWMLALTAAVSFGLTAAAATFTICTLLYQLRYLSRVLPLLGFRLSDYLATYTIPLLATATGVLIYNLLTELFSFSNWLHVVLSMAIGGGILLSAVFVQKDRLREEVRHWNFKNVNAKISDEAALQDA